MSTIVGTLARSGVGASAMLPSLPSALKRFWAAHARRRDQQRAIALLDAMSDRELKDIGLHRAQIEAAVTGSLRP